MTTLEEKRQEIDRIDRDMADLFRRRMACAEEIGRYKKLHDLPVLDSSREQDLLRRNLSLVPEALAQYYRTFFQGVLTASKAYQSALYSLSTVGYAGVSGSFAELAALHARPDARKEGFPSFSSAFDALERGEVDEICVPFENTASGDVGGVLDLLFSRDVLVSESFEMRVVQNLVALPGATLSGIRDVYSKQEALDQCARFLRDRSWSLHATANTALAAEQIAREGDLSRAAVASSEAASRLGLVLLASDIATDGANATRFVMVGKTCDPSRPHTGLLLETGGGAGALAPAIALISNEHHLSMSKITSRPLSGSHFGYVFYIEIESPLADEATKHLLADLEKIAVRVRLVGTF